MLSSLLTILLCLDGRARVAVRFNGMFFVRLLSVGMRQKFSSMQTLLHSFTRSLSTRVRMPRFLPSSPVCTC